MRFHLPLGRTLFFVCVLLFMLLALLPLRLALEWLGLDDRGLAAREAKGSIWFGALSETQLGPVALGDLTARLNGLPLLVGRARVSLDREEEADRFEGAITVTRHSFGVGDLTASLDLGPAFAPLPIASLDATAVSARFADELCASAEGQVKATITGDVAGLVLPGGLSGNARCDEGALLLPLVSQSGMEALNLKLRADGRYEVELAVRPLDDAMRDRLTAAGFQLTNRGYILSAAGTL